MPVPLGAKELQGGWGLLPGGHTPWPASAMALGSLRTEGSCLGKSRPVSTLDRQWSKEAAGCPAVALFPDSVTGDQGGGPGTFLHLRLQLCSGGQTGGQMLPSGLVQSRLCVQE